MIELPYFFRARLLTQLGSLEFRGMFQVHFFVRLPYVGPIAAFTAAINFFPS
jgi:hypothetical protein